MAVVAIFYKKQFKNSKTISNSVYYAHFSEIILLHGRFSLNLLYDLMNKFFEEHLKAASERVSLLDD